MKYTVSFSVNGEQKTVDVDASMTLLQAIREEVHLTGTKQGCGNGECGACTVIMNNKPVRACLILAVEASGAEITTIEGIGKKDGGLSNIQQAFIDEGAVQCGFCSPGFIMAAEALFSEKPDASDEDIKEALGGHLCRCTGYESIFQAFRRVRNIYRKKKKSYKYPSG